MGSFLDKPKTEKSIHVEEGNGVHVGLAAMQGWRVDMEDAHTIKLGLDGAPDYSWFAVFDGHGGSLISQRSSEMLVGKIQGTAAWKSGTRDVATLSTALREGFEKLDEDLRQLTEIKRGDDHSGSTAIGALLTPENIIVANCGDSRCILVRGSTVVELSVDHKPYNETEQRRIEAAGGTVTMRRVNGDLAVSRALGDFVYKHNSDMRWHEQQVSAEPEIRCEARSADDQYLVLACDGIWDVMNNDEVAEFLITHARSGGDRPEQLAAALIDHCLELGSRDNMSVIVVAFPNAPACDDEARKSYIERERRREAEAREHAGGGGGYGDDNIFGRGGMGDHR